MKKDIKSISISDIKEILATNSKKLVWFLGLHAFGLIIFFVLIDVIFGGFVVYKYVFLADRDLPVVSGSVIKFNNNDYQNVLKEIKARELTGDGVTGGQ